MVFRLAASLLVSLLALPALAQDGGGFYLGAGVGTGQALGETLAVPHIAVGYAPRGGGLQVEAGADFAGQVRNRYNGSPDDRMRRHGRLAGSVAYAFPISERVDLDLGLHAFASLVAKIQQCGGGDACATSDGYSGIGPLLGATVSLGRVGVRAAGGYTRSSVGDVFDGPWARIGLRYRP